MSSANDFSVGFEELDNDAKLNRRAARNIIDQPDVDIYFTSDNFRRNPGAHRSSTR